MPSRWALGATLLIAGCGIENGVLDDGLIRQATETHFGSPQAPIDVGPVVISGDHAIADWTQGDFGGRALFERGSHGWGLLLCSGESIRRAENLKRAGVPAFNAERIAEQLAAAEVALPPERLARMRRFVGTAQDHENYVKTLGERPS